MSSNTPYYGKPTEPHNLGPQCRLAPVTHPFSPDHTDGIPAVNAQYFYMSPIPIDDPLSTSTIAVATDAKAARASLQPFSPGDNNALEKAWLGLASDEHRRNHSHARRRRSPSPPLARANADKLAAIIDHLAVEHAEKHAREGPARDSIPNADEPLPVPDSAHSVCCPALLVHVATALRTSFCAVARRNQHTLDRESVALAVMDKMSTMHTDSPASVVAKSETSHRFASRRLRGNSLVEMHAEPTSSSRPSSRDVSDGRRRAQSQTKAYASSVEHNANINIPAKSSLVDDGISGRPFVRVGTPESTTFSPPSSVPKTATSPTTTMPTKEQKRVPAPTGSPSSLPERGRQASRASVHVPVGVSRLHEVTLPALQMKPIYWSPVNDLSTVLRATWFYRDDMRPIDPAVANQLEAGYRELKPHTETWNDELRCAIEVGPLGEEKVSHPLWPTMSSSSAKTEDESSEPSVSSNPFCAARCFRGEAAAEGSLLPTPNEDNSLPLQPRKKFEHYHVIYKDEMTAFLLKPSLKPSAYYGRRPVAKIAKGLTIGIPVVRGFDYETWTKTHQKKQVQQQDTPHARAAAAGYARSRNRDGVCSACMAEKQRSQVTDLVLVVHGIGQKLAERVENYHFTHAINAFRRAVNVELGSEAVRGVLRDGQNGIMVLPVNWRQNLSFEDGGPLKEEDKADYTPEGFSLKDIEPKTIPAVRSMISDVMFDIPFYMSHHKPKMVSALVGEANRVYRLWCRNNSGFSENGRVHLIGHSLGSVMSVEVLSRQPTTIPALQLAEPPQTKFFEFDTKNIFLVGSPAAFFLLLERGTLLPRRGRTKPGAHPADTTDGDVIGDAGMFGCLAVDNIYNILAREDAVAYLLNGTVDPKYAASLKTAYVPSASPSFLQSVGSAVKGFIPGASSSPAGAAKPALVMPPTVRLPSQLELEVHDFTREDIAEKKAFLLNDNGQIDYFLRSGGGPLELQYLNMLSAHTSYWLNHDFIRMLCQEIGRKPGRANTLPAMRAMKITKRALPSAS
ncbi:Uu.00g063090.m01.CDS01 [Anthostomella pinea]|uniref:Uu.00g063090.m01.CDS01 n=1 Tax=Anthostomella pinea TaxID=933095 RepID=A0AAI8YMV0_9PEZI|nr:Uu.00g063090.m01.CDS01 [Anthostomella pinea]